jgi:cellobiose-specific phosphotransferase system component IIB
MARLGDSFVTWIADNADESLAVEVIDAEHVSITGSHATGQLNYYSFADMPEIVEMSVTEDQTSESLFFLHFELEDLSRAQELYREMESVILNCGERTTTRVLLCCTTGMTTTLFASKLQEAADTLSLDYTFEAMALADAKATDVRFDAVMLAPQVGFQRREVKRSFPDCVVFEIPAKVFGAYDAAGALRMLMGLLGDDALATPDPTDLRLAREMKNDQVVLLISVIRKPKFTLISWRVYDRFTLVASGKVHKCHVNVNDLVDVLATLPYKNIEISDIDAVGIALPGAVDYGNVRFVTNVDEVVNVEKVLGERFGVRVFVDNNANAAAVGCYVTTDKYDSVVLHTQQTGYLVGGEGTVANGHLLRGRRGMAGELGSLDRRLFLQGGLHLPELGNNADPTFEDAEIRSDIVWEASRMLPILGTTLIANICVTAPDAIYVAYDLIDDMDALRRELEKTLDPSTIPDLIHIDDYHERIFVGEMALVLQRLNTTVA